jgi:hypothetical protein
MSNYYVMPIESEEHGFIWCVMESATNQLIYAYPFEDDANEHMKFLSRGGGFDGWTPPFFVNTVTGFKVDFYDDEEYDDDDSNEEINEAFDEELA